MGLIEQAGGVTEKVATSFAGAADKAADAVEGAVEGAAEAASNGLDLADAVISDSGLPTDAPTQAAPDLGNDDDGFWDRVFGRGADYVDGSVDAVNNGSARLDQKLAVKLAQKALEKLEVDKDGNEVADEDPDPPPAKRQGKKPQQKPAKKKGEGKGYEVIEKPTSAGAPPDYQPQVDTGTINHRSLPRTYGRPKGGHKHRPSVQESMGTTWQGITQQPNKGAKKTIEQLQAEGWKPLRGSGARRKQMRRKGEESDLVVTSNGSGREFTVETAPKPPMWIRVGLGV